MLNTSKPVRSRWQYLLLIAIALPVLGGLYYALIEYFLFG
jgi:hypothetical protein